MQKRIEWTDIFTFYLSADSITLRDCAEKFQVNYDVVRQKASKKKWRQEKEKTRQVAIEIVEEKISTNIAKINEKHIKIALALQKEAMKAMVERGISPTTAQDILSWIAAGVKIEKRALGMNQPTQPKIETTGKITNEPLLEEGEQKDKSA